MIVSALTVNWSSPVWIKNRTTKGSEFKNLKRNNSFERTSVSWSGPKKRYSLQLFSKGLRLAKDLKCDIAHQHHWYIGSTSDRQFNFWICLNWHRELRLRQMRVQFNPYYLLEHIPWLDNLLLSKVIALNIFALWSCL